MNNRINLLTLDEICVGRHELSSQKPSQGDGGHRPLNQVPRDGRYPGPFLASRLRHRNDEDDDKRGRTVACVVYYRFIVELIINCGSAVYDLSQASSRL